MEILAWLGTATKTKSNTSCAGSATKPITTKANTTPAASTKASPPHSQTEEDSAKKSYTR